MKLKFGYNSIYKKEGFYTRLLSRAILLVCVVLALFVIAFSVVYDSAPVQGESMQPTLNAKGSNCSDVVYINRMSNFNRGDIVVLEKDISANLKYVVKRVIGLPGDSIDVKYCEDENDFFVYRNGVKLIESYIYKESDNVYNRGMEKTYDNFQALRDSVMGNGGSGDIVFDNKGALVVQKGQVFLLGDNRGLSLDSSVEGANLISRVIGRVDFVLPYSANAFTYFIKYYFGFTNVKL